MSFLLSSGLMLILMIGFTTSDAPENIAACNTINFNNLNGEENHSLFVIDLEISRIYNFPFEQIDGVGTPIYGQPMHTSIFPGNEYIHMSVGGTAALPLRIYTVKLDWSNSFSPIAHSVAMTYLMEAGQAENNVDFYCPMNPLACPYQEAHGLWEYTSIGGGDKQFLSFSILTYNSIGVMDVTDVENPVLLEIVRDEDVLITPHGLYPNPSGTMAMSTQYRYAEDEVSIWRMNDGGQIPEFVKTLQLLDMEENVHGAFSHVGVWLDGTTFLTSSSHESGDNGNGGEAGIYEAGVWLCDIESDTTCKSIIREETDAQRGVLAAVSDLVVVKRKIITAEGMFLQGSETEGHISCFDVSGEDGCTMEEPCFLKRHSASERSASDQTNTGRAEFGPGFLNGPGTLLEVGSAASEIVIEQEDAPSGNKWFLPADYFDTHGMCSTEDENFVVAASFQAGYVVVLDGETCDIVRVFGNFKNGSSGSTRMHLPHGLYCS